MSFFTVDLLLIDFYDHCQNIVWNKNLHKVIKHGWGIIVSHCQMIYIALVGLRRKESKWGKF